MDEGTFGEWLKRDGEFVKAGQSLFVLEGEKSAQDIESFDEGILRIPADAPRPGDTVKVGQVLAFLVQDGEPAPFETTGAQGRGAKPQATAAAVLKPEASIEVVAYATTEIAPAQNAGVKASPRARRRAAQTGVDLTTLPGSGSTGRIRERDVLAAQSAKPQAMRGAARDIATTTKSTPDASGTQRTLAVSPIRRTIAARMLAGAHDAAPVTLTTRCDATNLVALRAQFRVAGSADQIVPDYNDLIVKLTATALERHPIMTAHWTDREIVFAGGIHISIAVDTDAGLLAPVVRDVNRLTLRQLAEQIRGLADRARSGKLAADDMQHGVFTVTNLGAFGIEAFTPIINLPQSAILGVGAIVREPAVVNDQIVARDQLTLSLTFDHRVVDGAPAARFLKDLRQGIEQPGAWLVP
jgi:pyruvate dehydrogenase E2 component (dihydrolipoamide acetyltransferase)